MRIMLIFHTVWLSVNLFALNMYPIPTDIYTTIHVNAAYKTTIMSSLSVTDGHVHSTIPSLDIGLGIGSPFTGFGIVMNTFKTTFVQQIESDVFTETTVGMTAWLLRYHLPLIVDPMSIISVFGSFGPYSLSYTIDSYIESDGSNSYKERSQSGYLGEVGLIVTYNLNPTWQLFLSTAYQISSQNGLKNPVGSGTDDSPISLRGASFTIGSNIQL